MVGDRKYDIAGAKAIGIDSVGVLYGFGSAEELREAGAGRIVVTVEELYKVLMN
jgi:phosphoglycolate phosphatase